MAHLNRTKLHPFLAKYTYQPFSPLNTLFTNGFQSWVLIACYTLVDSQNTSWEDENAWTVLKLCYTYFLTDVKPKSLFLLTLWTGKGKVTIANWASIMKQTPRQWFYGICPPSFLLLLRKAVYGSKWVRDGEDSFDNSGLDWLISKLRILLLHNLLYCGATSITAQHPQGKCDDLAYPVKMWIDHVHIKCLLVCWVGSVVKSPPANAGDAV